MRQSKSSMNSSTNFEWYTFNFFVDILQNWLITKWLMWDGKHIKKLISFSDLFDIHHVNKWGSEIAYALKKALRIVWEAHSNLWLIILL